MSRGKYSPCLPTHNKGFEYFDRNAKGEIPGEFVAGQMIEEIHFANYDPEGFDMYGYSAYLKDGTFIGMGRGIDRLGNTEDEYLTEFTDDEFNNL